MLECKLNGKELQMCAGLKSVIADYYHRSTCKGIVHTVLVNSDTRELKTRIQIRSGEHTHKNPILMNFCPFCGADIRTWEEEREASDENNA
jgi:hypothetical protein